MSADYDAASPAASPAPARRCACCQEDYDGAADMAVFGVLSMPESGTIWALCGPCIQVMWRERAPSPDPLD